MTSLPERQLYVSLINEAVETGARKALACAEVGISIRTLQRWCTTENDVQADQRTESRLPSPSNKLSEAERQQIIEISSREEFASLPPCQIVPILADTGKYFASESTFYRVLKAADLLRHRGRAKPRDGVKKPTSHTAKGPNEVWTWDISYLPTTVIGRYFYLYMIEDIYSRKIVGWEVHLAESGEHAAELVERSIWSEQCVKKGVVLHSDNGSPMKSLTLQAKMYELGVLSSRSRPRVSNDNPFSESLFRTLKYCPRWPSEGFESLENARQWVLKFVSWYNEEHRHSRINFVTPGQRHRGEDVEILRKRKALYERQRQAQPSRWSGPSRDWSVVGPVELNPEQTKAAA
jgi:transposase InsO family protein